MLFSLLLVGIYALLTGLLILYSRHITIPFGSAILLLSGALFSLLLWSLSAWFIVFIVAIFAGWIAFCYRFKRLDYSHRIISLPHLQRKKEGRALGKVQAYYKKQLRYNGDTVFQDTKSLQGGTIITGSSGSGKTVSVIEMIAQDLAAKKNVCFINFKGDKETEDTLAQLVETLQTNHIIYRLNYENVDFSYDPLINLDNTGRTEAILNMRAWAMDASDAHYKTGVKLLLQKTLNEYEHEGGNFLFGYYEWLKKYSPEKSDIEAYNTVMKLLELTVESRVGELFKKDLNSFSFAQDKPYLILVSFTSATKELGTSITSLMLKDLMEVGTKSPYSPNLMLYIDEFGSCESPLIVKDILEKGRSCGICTTISMQDLNQLIINTSEPFLDSVLGTVNSYIAFSGCTRDTAQKISGTQIHDIDNLLMSLRKPDDGKPPTAIFISKYPVFRHEGTEVYRFVPIKQKLSPESAPNAQKKVPTITSSEKEEVPLKEQINSPEEQMFDSTPLDYDIDPFNEG